MSEQWKYDPHCDRCVSHKNENPQREWSTTCHHRCPENKHRKVR